jgi:succinyl-CoA synthetase alpha subunit
MGHAGAIIYGNYGSAESKMASFFKSDVPVAKTPSEVPILLSQRLKK